MRALLLVAFVAILFPPSASARFTDFAFSRFGSNFCGLLESGRAECVNGGSADVTALAADLEQTYTKIGLGSLYACGITTVGEVDCWGSGGEGQLSPPAFDAPVVTLSVGDYHACAIDSDSNLKCWGQNVHGQTEPPPPATGFRDVVAYSIFNSCGVRIDGELVCWGRLLSPQFPQGLDDVSLSPIVNIETNGDTGCVIRTDGTADCWQGNPESTVVAEFRNGPYESVFPLASGDNTPMCALTVNGELDCAEGPYERGSFGLAPLPLGVTRSSEFYQLTRGSGQFVYGLTFDGRIEAINVSLGTRLQQVLDTINGELDIHSATLTDAQYYGPATGVELFFDFVPRAISLINNDLEVFRNGELIAVTDNLASYLDSTVVEGQLYEYTVRVVHVLGQKGYFSNAISVNTTSMSDSTDVSLPIPDTSRPDKPAGLRAEIYWFDVELFWDRNNSGNVAAYEIRKNGELVAVTRGTSWYDDSGAEGDNPQYDVLAVGQGNQLLGIDSVSVQIGVTECR